MSDTENTTPESTSQNTQSAAEDTQAQASQADVQPSADVSAEAEQPEGVAGVALMIAAFQTEDAGDKALKAMKKAKKGGQFYYEAAAVIKKEADGDVHYHETGDMSTGKGAGIGAIVGGVIGILGGPVGIGLGAAAGAGIGAIAAHGDAGFRDSSLDQIGAALRPGSSALMVITSKKFLHEFRKQVSDADLYPMMQAIGSTIADAQLNGQDMVLGIVLTEEGVAVQRMAADETTAEIFGFTATGAGVAAGAAYADESGIIYQVGVSDAEGTQVQSGVITNEGAVIVDQNTPAGSDETTVQVTEYLPDDGSETPAITEDSADDDAA